MAAKTLFKFDKHEVITVNTGEPWQENCYLVRHLTLGEQTVIDPGNATDEIIDAVVSGSGYLRNILLTHAHFDHVGGAAILTQRFNLPCRLHKGDLRQLRHAPMYALRFVGKCIELPVSYQTLDDEQPLQFGEQVIDVIHTPGHTPGSVCYLINDIVFTGDTLLHERVGRTDLPGGNLVELKDSVNRLLNALPNDTILFPGHGLPWTIGEARTWWLGAASTPPAPDSL